MSLFDTRRHLTDFDSSRSGNMLTDVLVIGCGVGGTCAALEASENALVTLLTKAHFDDSATFHAQGGIAAALTSDDSPDRHKKDTLQVGCGLCDPNAVEFLAQHGPQRIAQLRQWGIELDLDAGDPALAREGGHSLPRIVHAHGDQTGRELVRTLKARVMQTSNIRVFEDCYVIDLLILDGSCVGAVTFHKHHGHQLIWARRTVLASGGCGQLWRETTNPDVSTGDGLAIAFRAGATLRDMEFVQFHPTTLYVAGSGRTLISEAVRGEGGLLVDRDGHRFMTDYHPDGELAPRDVVSQSIHHHLTATRSNCVYLDVRHLTGFRKRFPHITRLCEQFRIDPNCDLIPVRPSAHYMIGGVAVALDATTNLPGLICCGEAASSGVHGANRLASNSLLEGLVFGQVAGRTAAEQACHADQPLMVHRVSERNSSSDRTRMDLADIVNSLRSVMWRNVGIVRTAERLRETNHILDFWGHYTLDKTFENPIGWEVQNRLTVANLIAASALQRADSIGVHYRTDHPDPPSSNYHLTITRSQSGTAPARQPLEQ